MTVTLQVPYCSQQGPAHVISISDIVSNPRAENPRPIGETHGPGFPAQNPRVDG
jgi:hypothetical protein